MAAFVKYVPCSNDFEDDHLDCVLCPFCRNEMPFLLNCTVCKGQGYVEEVKA